MTAAASTSHPQKDPNELLASALADPAAATKRDDVLTIASRGSRGLCSVDDLCLLRSNAPSDTCLNVLPDSPRVVLARGEGQWLQRSATAAGTNGRTVVLSGLMPLDRLVPQSGESQRIGTVLVIPLIRSSGYRAMLCSWREARHLRTAQIRPLQVLAAATALALRVAAQAAELTETAQRHQQLVSELLHRQRNTLAFLRSILRRTSETAESTEDFALHLEGRIGTLVRTQNSLATGMHDQSATHAR